jgi:hypothetical protein
LARQNKTVRHCLEYAALVKSKINRLVHERKAGHDGLAAALAIREQTITAGGFFATEATVGPQVFCAAPEKRETSHGSLIAVSQTRTSPTALAVRQKAVVKHQKHTETVPHVADRKA